MGAVRREATLAIAAVLSLALGGCASGPAATEVAPPAELGQAARPAGELRRILLRSALSAERGKLAAGGSRLASTGRPDAEAAR